MVSIRGLINPVSIRAMVGIDTPDFSESSACDHFRAARPDRIAELSKWGFEGRNMP